MTVVATYPKLAHDWLKHELDPTLYRRAGVIASGAGKLITGTVLGVIALGDAASEVKAGGNTGAGTLTLDVTAPVQANAKVGVYSVRCIAEAADGGTFRVEDPDGVVIGDVAVGDTFSDGIKFVIADSGEDFDVGDGFDVTVDPGSEKYVPLDVDALDGSQNAAAVLINGCDATDADAETAILIGKAQVVPSQMIWPAGITSNEKAAALKQLAALDIVSHQRF